MIKLWLAFKKWLSSLFSPLPVVPGYTTIKIQAGKKPFGDKPEENPELLRLIYGDDFEEILRKRGRVPAPNEKTRRQDRPKKKSANAASNTNEVSTVASGSSNTKNDADSGLDTETKYEFYNTDRDSDGINDNYDADLDNDGIRNEYDRDRDNDGLADQYDLDADGDGVEDKYERPSYAFDEHKDSDGDGVPDYKDDDDKKY